MRLRLGGLPYPASDPVMASADAARVGAGYVDLGGDPVGHGDVDIESAVGPELPSNGDVPVRRLERRLGPGEPSAGGGGDADGAVAGFRGGDPADHPVHPVGDRAERVVVETGHLPRVDS